MGPDKIPAVVLNITIAEPNESLDKLLQCNYNTGINPAICKIAHMYFVHKKEVKSILANYQGSTMAQW